MEGMAKDINITFKHNNISSGLKNYSMTVCMLPGEMRADPLHAAHVAGKCLPLLSLSLLLSWHLPQKT